MTRHLRRAALSALPLAAALLLPACAADAPPASPPQPNEPPPSLWGPGEKGKTPVDDHMLALAKAEDEIDHLFPDAGKPPSRKKPSPKAPSGSPGAGPMPADDAPGKVGDKKDEATQLATVDPCAVACRALASMVSSADHLCKLTGEGDGRCDDARGRVRGASARVRSVCPSCTAGAR